MTECRSPELQDLLPDFVADTLDEVSTARVTAHLDGCAVCTDDVAVLRLVRQSRPRVAVPDVARIVAALPAPAGHVPEAGSLPVAVYGGPRLVHDVASPAMSDTPARAVPPSMRSARPRGSIFGLSVFRLAATLGVVIAGGASLLVARRGIGDLPTTGNGSVMTAESAYVSTPSLAPELAETVAVASIAERSEKVSVSYGDLGDYSEDELQRMLDRLEQWDGATSTEPLPGVPILPSPGGNTP